MDLGPVSPYFYHLIFIYLVRYPIDSSTALYKCSSSFLVSVIQFHQQSFSCCSPLNIKGPTTDHHLIHLHHPAPRISTLFIHSISYCLSIIYLFNDLESHVMFLKRFWLKKSLSKVSGKINSNWPVKHLLFMCLYASFEPVIRFVRMYKGHVDSP